MYSNISSKRSMRRREQLHCCALTQSRFVQCSVDTDCVDLLIVARSTGHRYVNKCTNLELPGTSEQDARSRESRSFILLPF